MTGAFPLLGWMKNGSEISYSVLFFFMQELPIKRYKVWQECTLLSHLSSAKDDESDQNSPLKKERTFQSYNICKHNELLL